jgi:hypothetical protein
MYEIDLLFEVCKRGRVQIAEPELVNRMVEKGLITKSDSTFEIGSTHVDVAIVEITEAGNQVLRETIETIIKVNIPFQGPLYLRGCSELIAAMQSGELEDTFDLLSSDYDEGDLLFSLTAKPMSLYELATLPEWEPC